MKWDVHRDHKSRRGRSFTDRSGSCFRPPSYTKASYQYSVLLSVFWNGASASEDLLRWTVSPLCPRKVSAQISVHYERAFFWTQTQKLCILCAHANASCSIAPMPALSSDHTLHHGPGDDTSCRISLMTSQFVWRTSRGGKYFREPTWVHIFF